VFAASEGSVEWCRGGGGVWIYPSSRIDRGGRIYGNVCVYACDGGGFAALRVRVAPFISGVAARSSR